MLPPSAVRAPECEVFRRDVLHGLRQPHKELPCKYLYDARGSRLFDAICHLEEYYPTRCELEVLRQHGEELAAALGPGIVLIEYGSGSSLKTRLLLGQLRGPATYVPVDISRDHLMRAAERLRTCFPNLPVRPVVADFTRSFRLPDLPAAARRVVYFSGSTIGNFPPDEAVALLAGIRRLCGADGGLLIGVDLKKDVAILERAYNDARGVTAAFNLNLLERINRELGADFDPGRFRHLAFYDTAHGRIEMHLISLAEQDVRIGNARFHFRQGESIRTENSYKFSPEDFAALAGRAGLTVRSVWTDEGGLYSVQYLEPV
jgi:L-histidine N-alpha-methyltransferase